MALSNHHFAFASALLPNITNYDSPDFRSHCFAMQPEPPESVAGFHVRCFDIPSCTYGDLPEIIDIMNAERKDGCGCGWVGIELRGWGCLCIKRLVTRSHALGSQRI